MKSEIKKKIKATQAAQVKAQPAAIPDKKSENQFIFSVLFVYIVVALIGVFHHEMWRDEMQNWAVGAASSSFGDYLHNMKTQLDPYTWYTINFILTRLFNSPLAAQIVNCMVSSGSVFLILKYSPFTRLQKVLLSFSYYMLFEYSIMERGYGLVIFLVFLFCTVYKIYFHKNRYIILGLILFCMPNIAGVHGIITTLALLGMMISDYYSTGDVSIRKNYKPLQLFLGIVIVLIGLYIAYKCVAPPSGTSRSDKWVTSFDSHRVMFTLRTFWMCYLPIPNPSAVVFWNSNLLYSSNPDSFAFDILFLVALSIFLFSLLFFSNKVSAAVLYLAGTGGVLLLFYSNTAISNLVAARHYGFMFISFIAAVWLAADVKKSKFSIPALNRLRNTLKADKNFSYLLTGLLVVNTLGAAIIYGKDFTLPFSNIKATGEYIVSHHLDKLPETGFNDYAVSPLAVYTKQAIYFPDRDTTCKYTIWSDARFSFDMNVLMTRLNKFISKQKDSVLFISNFDYFGIGEGKAFGNLSFTRIASFSGANVPDENFILYIARNNPALALLSSGYDSLQKGKLDEAEKIFLAVKEKANGAAVPHLHNYLGMLYVKRDMPGDAEKEFNTEISLNLQKEEAYFNLGMLYFGDKDYDKAIQSWNSAVSINPNNSNAYNNLGVCYLNFKKDYAKGITFFEKAVELDPGFTQGYINILICAQNSNDEAAIIKYTRVLLDKGMSINDIKAKGINISDALQKKINSR